MVGSDRNGNRAALTFGTSALLVLAVLVVVCKDAMGPLSLFEWDTGNDPIVPGRSVRIEGKDPDDPFYQGSSTTSSLKAYRDCPMCAGTKAEHKYLRMLEEARSQMLSLRANGQGGSTKPETQVLALRGPKNVLNKVLERTSAEIQKDALSYKSIAQQRQKARAEVRLLMKKKTELDSEVKEVQRDMERIAKRQEATVDTLKAR